MQLTDLLEAIEILRDKDWVVKPPAHKSRTRIISEAMSAPNQKRSTSKRMSAVNLKRSRAAKLMWRKRRKAA
jgi:hypothetical protein